VGVPLSAVLIVDDEPDVRLVTRVILEAVGYDVHEAESGEAALDILGSGLRADVVLLDVRMPGIDGWEVLRRLRADPGHLCRLPVVIFTADIAFAEQAPVELRDREFFLGKPFDPDDLIDLVSQAVSTAAA
jgi:two-component system, OmpR family, alkaline phosphatase synthesis response regulator PhoP